MSKYNLDFNIDTKGVLKISVSNAGIAFSKESIERLGRPSRVNIGIDKKQSILGVRKAVEDARIKSYPFVTSEKRENWLRINSKPLIAEIASVAKITPTSSGTDFIADFDEEEQLLIVELKTKTNSNSKR